MILSEYFIRSLTELIPSDEAHDLSILVLDLPCTLMLTCYDGVTYKQIFYDLLMDRVTRDHMSLCDMKKKINKAIQKEYVHINARKCFDG